MNYISYLMEALNRSSKQTFMNEDAHSDAAQEILENLKQIKYDFEKKVLEPARELNINPDTGSDLKLADKTNPHIRAIYRVEEAIANLEMQLKVQLMDPSKDEEGEDMAMDMSGSEPSVDMGSMDMSGASDISVDTDMTESCLSCVKKTNESYRYYKGLHPEQTDEILNLNGWNYANNEIWDDSGVCSIVYDADEDSIFVFELLDPDGVEQELIATCANVDELDNALTNFVELDDIASEMKEQFAEYIANQRGEVTESVNEDSSVIDGWEYNSYNTEYNGNATLLWDDGELMILIQKDAESEEDSFLVLVGTEGNPEIEYESDSIDDLGAWLEINAYPSPTDAAKEAFYAVSESAPADALEVLDDVLEMCKDLPAEMREKAMSIKAGKVSSDKEILEFLLDMRDAVDGKVPSSLYNRIDDAIDNLDQSSMNEENKKEDKESDYDKTMKELCKSAPKDFKCVQDNQETSKLAKKVEKPKVTDIKKPSNK